MPWDFILIFLILGVVVPWRGAIRVRKLLARPALTTTDRLALYASTIAFQWLAVGMVTWRSLARGLSLHELGLTLPHPFHTVVVTTLITTAFCAFQFFGLRHAARVPPNQRGLVQQLAAKILPQNSIEQLAFIALVATVALCEEFLYRGFAFAAIARAAHQSLFAAALVSALFFAVAHLYQGRRGLISTFLIGIVFATVRITEESLAPAIVAHLFVDLIAGLLAPRLLLRRTQGEQAALSPPH
ncbi:MAG TPA: CPBP family intramembrane glutamic endopeptidase [Candidatus Dormibacteraeota bacterium]|nr:CPBP family intramembrane glutamic endopeptidase [Candidatus Dormibacteraeota bacterium]